MKGFHTRWAGVRLENANDRFRPIADISGYVHSAGMAVDDFAPDAGFYDNLLLFWAVSALISIAVCWLLARRSLRWAVAAAVLFPLLVLLPMIDWRTVSMALSGNSVGTQLLHLTVSSLGPVYLGWAMVCGVAIGVRRRLAK